MERHGWTSVEDFRGIRRDRVVTHSKIRRPDAKAYHGGYEAEGYAAADAPAGSAEHLRVVRHPWLEFRSVPADGQTNRSLVRAPSNHPH